MNPKVIKERRLKKAVITGISGQDGSFLAQLLLGKGYEVYGTYRRENASNFWRLNELGIDGHPCLRLVEYDMFDQVSALKLVKTINPDEIYNLAAQSFVGASFDHAAATAQITALGALYLLEAIRNFNPEIRFYQASSSEMFGKASEAPQTETTPFSPCSPYGVAKLYAHWMTVNYRELYGIFGVSGILYNHESPLRGKEFVTRKITDAVAKIKLGKLKCLELGNLNATRDWGYAMEYVDGMYRMLQADAPETFILATNRTETVRSFTECAFGAVGMRLEWQGKDDHESGIDIKSGQVLVRVNPKFYRPAEVVMLIGNPEKAKRLLGWEPKTNQEEICEMMVKADIARNQIDFPY